MKTIAFILGIRPDIIRASLILEHLKKEPSIRTIFIWSGQHYSNNLKSIFFRELEVKAPDITLNCGGETDAAIVSSVISQLDMTFEKIKPDAAVFLGDTNTVVGSLAAAMHNIPIIHIEGCMRSYDWRMPEEKYRTTVDHLSDVIYAYFDEYKSQGIREGINPRNIVVVGNPIVDIVNRFYLKKKEAFQKKANNIFFKKHNVQRYAYYVMTCHRRENVMDLTSLRAILNLVEQAPYPVYFPASYRTQKTIKKHRINLPKNLKMTDPIGYIELLLLMTNSRGVLTDSGTVVEETSIIQIPTIQLRRSTERPQVYDVGGCVKFDPSNPKQYPGLVVYKKLESLFGKSWKHVLGDGNTSKKIANDLVYRLKNNLLDGHRKENYHIPVKRSYREDSIKIKK